VTPGSCRSATTRDRPAASRPPVTARQSPAADDPDVAEAGRDRNERPDPEIRQSASLNPVRKGLLGHLRRPRAEFERPTRTFQACDEPSASATRPAIRAKRGSRRYAEDARRERRAGLGADSGALSLHASRGHSGMVAASLQVRERWRRRRFAAQPLAVPAKPVSTARLALARSGGRPDSRAKRRDARLWRFARRASSTLPRPAIVSARVRRSQRDRRGSLCPTAATPVSGGGAQTVAPQRGER
jgi:hypothetical protein